MKKERIDAWLIFTREGAKDPLSKEFGLEACTWRSAGILTRENETIAIVGSYDVKQVERSGIYDQVIGYGSEGISLELSSISSKLGFSKIAINESSDYGLADGLTASMKRYLLKNMHGASFVSSEDLAIDLRGRLLPEETKKMRNAIKMTEEILDETQSHAMKIGKRDKDVFEYVQKITREYGAGLSWDESMDPSLCVGSIDPQHSGYDNVLLREGKFLRIDFGIKLDGYCSDLQRDYYFGTPPKELKNDFAIAREANDAAITKLSGNSLGFEVDRAGRSVVTRNGFQNFPHGLGHTLARTAHEIGPIFAPKWRRRYGHAMDKRIGTNICLTIEPTVYSKFGGINLEQDVLVNDEGRVEFLSFPQEEIISL
jgi:Xaa-Pro aminopeptidase